MVKATELPELWQNDALPHGFVLSKPKQQGSFPIDEIYKLETIRRLVITRKRDGWKVFVYVDRRGHIKLYTDGINEIDERVKHIRSELAQCQIPPCSLLVGELILDSDDNDDFTGLSGVMHRHRESVMRQKALLQNLKLMLFDAIFWDGKNLQTSPIHGMHMIYPERLSIIRRCGWGRRFVLPVQTLIASFNEAKQLVVKHDWEGLVLYDTGFTCSFRFDWKSPARPKGCYKWKPVYEDDFIVRDFVLDSKNSNRLKEVVLLQVDPGSGREFVCGKLGSFSARLRDELWKAALPLVMQVAFEARFQSGKLRNARFVRLRPDKKPADCIAPKSFSKAEYVK